MESTTKNSSNTGSINGRKALEIVNEINYTLGLAGFKKKNNTYGGEYHGPCPHCKLTKGDGGDNRLQIHPERPIISTDGSRDEPFFFCRQCYRVNTDGTTDTSHVWSGDLIQYVRDVFAVDGEPRSMSWACDYLGIERRGGNTYDQRKKLKLSLSGAPSESWQKHAFEFCRKCVEYLWSEQGAGALAYLREDRGLSDEMIRRAQIGYNPEDQYVNAWDDEEEGRMRLPNGIVLPELHAGHMGVGIEIWSIEIRRSDYDLLIEEEETGETPAKYWFVSGGERALYLVESMNKDNPFVLVESRINALSIIQGTHEAYGAGALSSANGGRDMRTLMWLLRSKRGVLFGLDPDSAGEKAAKYWHDTGIKAANALPPKGLDYNSMLTQGRDIEAYLNKYRDRLYRKYPELNVSESQPEAQQGAEVTEMVSSVHQEDQGPNLSLSRPLEAIEFDETPEQKALDELWAKGCFLCGAEIATIYEDPMTLEVRGYCEEHHDMQREKRETAQKNKVQFPCEYYGCDAEGEYQDEASMTWCHVHFASKQLIDFGAQWGYKPLLIKGGEGFVGGNMKDGLIYEKASPAKLKGGRDGYIAFAKTETPATIWVAVKMINDILHGFERYDEDTEQRRSNAQACARFKSGCFTDASRPVQIWHDEIEEIVDGKKQTSYKYPASDPRTFRVNGKAFRFCGRCTVAVSLLHYAEFLDWCDWHQFEINIDAGPQAWTDFVTTAPLSSVTQVHDRMRLEYAELTPEVQELMF